MRADNKTVFYPIISADTISIVSGLNKDPYEFTPVSGYVYAVPGTKGSFGEHSITDLMKSFGHDVRGSSRENPGYDRIINNIKTEIKFSAAGRNAKDKSKVNEDSFIFNHFSVSKDWDRAILAGHNLSHTDIVWFTKADFILNLQDANCFFKRQQAGAGGNNDDWWYNTTNNKKTKSWKHFLKLPWVRSISEW